MLFSSAGGEDGRSICSAGFSASSQNVAPVSGAGSSWRRPAPDPRQSGRQVRNCRRKPPMNRRPVPARWRTAPHRMGKPKSCRDSAPGRLDSSCGKMIRTYAAHVNPAKVIGRAAPCRLTTWPDPVPERTANSNSRQEQRCSDQLKPRAAAVIYNDIGRRLERLVAERTVHWVCRRLQPVCSRRGVGA